MNRVIRTRRAFSFAMVTFWMLAGLLVTLLAVAFYFWREIREEWYWRQSTLSGDTFESIRVAAEGRLGEVGSARLVPRILDRLLMSGSSPIVKGSRLCGYSRDGWMHHGGYEITDLVSCPTVVKVQVPGGVEVFFQRLPPGSGEPLAGLSTRNEVWSQESFTYDFQPLLRILYREGSQARGFLFESLGSGDPRRRSLAACLLGTAGLAEALGHADERIRTAAREELERIEVLR